MFLTTHFKNDIMFINLCFNSSILKCPIDYYNCKLLADSNDKIKSCYYLYFYDLDKIYTEPIHLKKSESSNLNNIHTHYTY